MIPGIREIGFGPGSERPYATLHEATASFAVMGDRTITTQVRIDGDVVPDFDGWALEFKGERFVLPVKEPQAQKNNTTRNSLVDLTFYSWPIYQMKRFFFFETTTTATGTVMADKYQASVNLNLVDFVALFNRVLDYYFDGKIIADLAQGSYGTAVSAIQLNYSYVWDVLQDLYSIFNVRWTIEYDDQEDVYTIKIGYSPDVISEHEFEYGFQGGLLHFERQLQDDNIKNILLGRGGEKNLPYRYFKKQDPNNPDWAADPDGIKELENIYFDRLRDQNFRNYIQGWKTNPNRMLDTGDVVEPYDSSRGEMDWAYKKGHEDELFDPVEYVKDQDSIEKYGERWGALDDNDDIFPTIQGITRAGLGRVDEVVDVSPILTDDVQASMEAAAELVSLNGVMNQTSVIAPVSYIVKQIRGGSFEIPTGQTANLRDPIFFAVNKDDPAYDAYVSVNTDLSKVRIYNSSTDQEVPAKGIPAGSYYWVIDITVQSTIYQTLTVTYGVNGLELEVSDASAESWKPTFDIWIKNIFDSVQEAEETDEDYALRIWREILGDRLGNEAKIAFSDGAMSISEDYEFVIATYPTVDRSKVIGGYRSEWKITLYKCAAEYEVSGLYIPNNTSGGKPVAGDHFYFLGIDMPHIYVTLAEERLNQYKTAALEQMAEVNPTWVIHLDKVRADMVNADQQRFYDQISAGCEMHVKDKRFTKDEILRLFANTITYSWHEPTDDNPYLLPDMEIVVSDKIVVEKSTVDKIQGDLDVLKATYAKMSDMAAVIQQVASPMFLRKTGEQDTSLSPTRFASTVTSRDFRQGGFGGQGWGLYRDNSSKYQKTPVAESTPTRGALRSMAKGGTRDASPTVEEQASDSVMEIDKLVVRKEMQVNSLVVNQIAYIGGKQINSAAAIECVQVIETNDSYICYFDQKQGSVKNLFVVGDIAMGQIFDPNNMTLRYYKMIVTATDIDNITLSKDGRAGSSAPMKGDVIVQYGNLYDESRQYVIIRDVIGGGYERMLSDLNSVDATGTEYYFAGCDMSSDGVATALFSSEPEPLFDSNGEPLMSTEYARARFFVGGDDSHMEFKQADRRLYLKGTIVQSPSGDEFPVVCYRGPYDETGQTLYYYGDEVTYRGATYLYINRVPSNTVPTDTTYWRVRAQAGISAKSVEIQASSLFFTFDHPDSTTPTGDQSIILTCVTQNITGATYVWSYWSGSDWTPISGQTSNALTVAYNSSWFNNGKVAKIKVVVGGDNSLYDEVSIYKVMGGEESISVFLTNPTKNFAAGDQYAVAATDTFEVIGFRGTAQLEFGEDFSIGTIYNKNQGSSVSPNLPTGMSVSIDDDPTSATYGTISVSVTTQFDTRQGTLIIPVTVSGYGTVNLEYNWTLALTGRGQKGDAGPAIRGPRQWDPNEAYVNDSEFMDIVYYDPTNSGTGLYYQRKPVNSGVAYSTTPDQDTTHWVESNKFAFVAADVILAPNGKINNLVVDQVKTTDPSNINHNPITIINDLISIDDKVKITSGNLPSGQGSAGSYSLPHPTINITTGQDGTVSGTYENDDYEIEITAENNVVRIPAIRMTTEWISSNILGQVNVEFYLKIGDETVVSWRGTAGSEHTEIVYYRSQSEYNSPGYYEKTLPVGTHTVRLTIIYSAMSQNAGGQARIKFEPKTYSDIPITYPAQFTMIATDGAQFRYGQDGIRADANGAKVIQSGAMYNIAGLGVVANQGLTAPKRIVFCTAYPNPEESDVFYIKVSSS